MQLLRSVLARGELALKDVGVVTPYVAQVRHLRRIVRFELPGVMTDALEIASVDNFQGREKELIIFSAVRSNRSGTVGFLADWRRLNVMLTRARRGLVVCGSAQTLKSDTHWSQWLDFCGKVATGQPRTPLPEPPDEADAEGRARSSSQSSGSSRKRRCRRDGSRGRRRSGGRRGGSRERSRKRDDSRRERSRGRECRGGTRRSRSRGSRSRSKRKSGGGRGPRPSASSSPPAASPPPETSESAAAKAARAVEEAGGRQRRPPGVSGKAAANLKSKLSFSLSEGGDGSEAE